MNAKRIVITGVNGFVGYHLTKELQSRDIYTIGVGQDDTINQSLSGIINEYHKANLIEEWPNIQNIDTVIHLAGLAAVGPSFDKPQLYINANTAMLTNLCEFYLKQDKKPRIIIISSGSVYDSNQPMPINESGKIGFTSPYVISKICNENQAEYYRKRGLDCIVTRPLNHIGPGQLDGFLVPDLYNQISSLKDDNRVINTGNIKTKRDYTDVRDIVRAYTLLALTDKLNFNTYNVCSGHSLSGVEIFEELKKAMNINDVEYNIDQSKIRPTDALDIFGDSSRLQKDTGWQPEIATSQTIKDFIEFKL